MPFTLGQLALLAVLVLLLLFVFKNLIGRPLKWILKIVYNSIIGILLLWGFNFLGNYIGVTLPINLFSVITVVVLGIPGLLLLVFLHLIT